MNQLPYLPNELIIQILLLLPVKSLIRFKCVCKFWFSIISSDTHFANSQFQLNAATHTHRVLFVSIVPMMDLEETTPLQTRSVDLEALLYNYRTFASHKFPTSFKLKVHVEDLLHYHLLPPIEIKGSCRGFILFLYRCYSSFYLWNPSTGVHKQIPFCPLTFILEEEADSYFYGFGYDHSTDDYLIVSMSLSSDIDSSYLEFFSLRANTWEQIDEDTHFPYSNATRDCRIAGLLFNGAIHWFAYHHDLEENVIVAFDLMERKLLDMHLPDQFDHKLSNCGLWVFRELLSLWVRDYDNHTIEIWVMKEYKVHSSWTKTLVLPTDSVCDKYFYPLTSTKSGDILATKGRTGFVKYNGEGQLLGHHSYSRHPCVSRVAMYTESLLSLPEDKQEQE